MSAKFEAFRRDSIAFAGAIFCTVVLIAASAPAVPVA